MKAGPLLVIHDDDADHDAAPGAINAAPWSLVICATSVRRAGWVVWYADDVTCCPNQSPVWRAEQIPGVWDTSGVGDLVPYPTPQCGACGMAHRPPYVVLVGHLDYVAGAAADIRAALAAEECPECRPAWRCQLHTLP